MTTHVVDMDNVCVPPALRDVEGASVKDAANPALTQYRVVLGNRQGRGVPMSTD